ncbi:relaxin-3b [Paramormyrops kingsleyae]|uniref:relaxin-3b n=1 Tax=Paramormyrops kingsleyae TaxID=1676925 RepID=UPI000CD6295A|nr:relaxin-3 [Paramormyrops kingsleyae]XP_023696770.1 relaxin-3 [Paramormyrops kingsleyae]
MWKGALLAACLLVARVGATDTHPAYGVKLCGREFIRAVIFTCGGSRWRRAVDTADDFMEDHFGPLNEASDSWSPNAIPGLPYRQFPAAETPRWSPWIRPVRSLISEEVLEALRTSDRKGRDVVVGLSNACCKWGCSKSEISSLC